MAMGTGNNPRQDVERVVESVWLRGLARVSATVVSPLAIAAMVALFNTMQDMSTSLALLEQRLGQREAALVELAGRVTALEAVRYTQTHADRDMAAVVDRLNRIDSRLTDIERTRLVSPGG